MSKSKRHASDRSAELTSARTVVQLEVNIDPVSISTIIPTFRRHDSLKCVLDSLRVNLKGAAPDNFEVIVVDNECSDEIENLVRRYSWQLNCKYLHCEEIGKNVALRVGIEHSSYRWLLFLDDDIVVEPQYLERLKTVIKGWPDAAAIGGKVMPEWPDGCRGAFPQELLEEVKSFGYGYFAPSETSGFRPPGRALMEGNMAIRKDDLELAGGFDPSCGPRQGRYRMGTHGNIFKRLGELGRPVVYDAGLAVRHLIRPEQMTWSWLLARSYSFGRSLGYLQYEARGIDGGAAMRSLLGQWILRVARQCFFGVKGKEIPMRSASLDRRLLEGILFERIVHCFRRAQPKHS